jgi:hypothetical protein
MAAQSASAVRGLLATHATIPAAGRGRLSTGLCAAAVWDVPDLQG